MISYPRVYIQLYMKHMEPGFQVFGTRFTTRRAIDNQVSDGLINLTESSSFLSHYGS